MRLPLSYRALQAEMILSPVLLTMTIINLFFAEIGLTQAQIGITQAVFTAVVLPLNIPFGKLADHTNRALVNAFGDLIAMFAFAVYAKADSFWVVIVSEALLAVGIAASRGTDSALLRGYCDAYSSLDYGVESAKIEARAAWAAGVGMILGSALGAVNLRAPFWADVAVFGTCVVLSLFVRDHSPRLSRNVRLLYVMHHTLIANKRLSARIMAIAPVREATHVLIWLMTPVMIATGLPVWAMGFGWLLNTLARIPGARMAMHLHAHSAIRRLIAPLLLSAVGMILCGIQHMSTVVVGIGFLGAATGFSYAISKPILAEACEASIQTTVSSIAGTVCQLIYIPAVMIVNAVASTYGTSMAYAVNGLLFGGLCLIGLLRLRLHDS